MDYKALVLLAGERGVRYAYKLNDLIKVVEKIKDTKEGEEYDITPLCTEYLGSIEARSVLLGWKREWNDVAEANCKHFIKATFHSKDGAYYTNKEELVDKLAEYIVKHSFELK